MALCRNLGFLGRSFLDSSKVSYLHCSNSVCNSYHSQKATQITNYAKYSRSAKSRVSLTNNSAPAHHTEKLQLSLIIRGDNNEKLSLKVGTLAWNYVRYGSLICILSVGTVLVYQLYQWIICMITRPQSNHGTDPGIQTAAFYTSLIDSVNVLFQSLLSTYQSNPVSQESSPTSEIALFHPVDYESVRFIVGGLYPFSREVDWRGETPPPRTILLPQIPHTFCYADCDPRLAEDIDPSSINRDELNEERKPSYLIEEDILIDEHSQKRSTSATISSNTAKRLSDSDDSEDKHRNQHPVHQQPSPPFCGEEDASCFSVVIASTLQDSGIDHSFYNTSSASFNMMTKSYSSIDLRNCDHRENCYALPHEYGVTTASCKSLDDVSDQSSIHFHQSASHKQHRNRKVLHPCSLYRLACEDAPQPPHSSIHSSKSSLSFMPPRQRYDAISIPDSTRSYCADRNRHYVSHSPANSHTTSVMDDVLNHRNHSLSSQHRTVLPLSENCSKLERIENHLSTVDEEVRGLERFLANQRNLRYRKEAEAFLLEMNLKTIKTEVEGDNKVISLTEDKEFYQPDLEYEDEFWHPSSHLNRQ